LQISSPQVTNLLQFVDTTSETPRKIKKEQFDLLLPAFIAALKIGLCTEINPAINSIHEFDILMKHKKDRRHVESAISEFYGPVVLRYLHTMNDNVFEDGIDMLIYNFKKHHEGT
jgi:hypothetical protein